jgi:low temperature requirement protein LtrA
MEHTNNNVSSSFYVDFRIPVLIEFIFFLPSYTVLLVVPMNVEFLVHRNGEWTMLMLGESILSLLIVDVPEEDTEYFTTFYCSLMTVILLQYLYFRSQPHNADDHAVRKDKHLGMMWTIVLFVYSASLVALGVALMLFVLSFSSSSSDSDHEDDPHRRTLFDNAARRLVGGVARRHIRPKKWNNELPTYSRCPWHWCMFPWTC